MKLIKKSVIALVVLVAAGASQAQQTAAAGTPVGRLGQRYVGTSFGASDFRNTPEGLQDASVGVNLPLTKSLDVDFGYGYQWLRHSPVDASAHSIDAGATYYKSTHGVKPFVSASLAYTWSKASYAGFSAKDNSEYYDVSVGIEVPVGPIVLSPAISYDDSFSDGGNGTFTYGADAHYWITPKVGVRANLSYSDYSDNMESWNYRIGLRVKF